jgi:inosine-uridine nucleoside N-ribohydrolase
MLLACAGCSVPKILGDGNHATYFENYLRYERPFTDATAVAARKDAEGECSRRKKVAVETNSTCTLTRCTTIYQCMDKADAAGYR